MSQEDLNKETDLGPVVTCIMKEYKCSAEKAKQLMEMIDSGVGVEHAAYKLGLTKTLHGYLRFSTHTE